MSIVSTSAYRQYPPIGDYAYIADCHSSALISKAGSIDWCCMPRFDSASCFGRLLGWEQGGYCQIVPVASYTVTRRYRGHNLILETTFHTDEGHEARLIDCFLMREGGAHHPYQQILRIIEGIKGEMAFNLHIVPRFDYGAVKPWISQDKAGNYIVIGGSDGLLIAADIACKMDHRHDIEGACSHRRRPSQISVHYLSTGRTVCRESGNNAHYGNGQTSGRDRPVVAALGRPGAH